MPNLFEKALIGIQKGAEMTADAVTKGAAATVDAVGKGAEAVGKSAADGWNTLRKSAGDITKGAVNTIDQNGDGKFDQEDVMIILGNIYDFSCNGIPNVSKSIEEFSEEFSTSTKIPKLLLGK